MILGCLKFRRSQELGEWSTGPLRPLRPFTTFTTLYDLTDVDLPCLVYDGGGPHLSK
jgi:hypothetical protein